MPNEVTGAWFAWIFTNAIIICGRGLTHGFSCLSQGSLISSMFIDVNDNRLSIGWTTQVPAPPRRLAPYPHAVDELMAYASEWDEIEATILWWRVNSAKHELQPTLMLPHTHRVGFEATILWWRVASTNHYSTVLPLVGYIGQETSTFFILNIMPNNLQDIVFPSEIRAPLHKTMVTLQFMISLQTMVTIIDFLTLIGYGAVLLW